MSERLQQLFLSRVDELQQDAESVMGVYDTSPYPQAVDAVKTTHKTAMELLAKTEKDLRKIIDDTSLSPEYKAARRADMVQAAERQIAEAHGAMTATVNSVGAALDAVSGYPMPEGDPVHNETRAQTARLDMQMELQNVPPERMPEAVHQAVRDAVQQGDAVTLNLLNGPWLRRYLRSRGMGEMQIQSIAGVVDRELLPALPDAQRKARLKREKVNTTLNHIGQSSQQYARHKLEELRGMKI
jgi:vacuolar-type H+-ATPase subunit H